MQGNRNHPAIVALRQARALLIDLSGWRTGAAFADERGWLKPEERARRKREEAAWPTKIRALRDQTRAARREHPAHFFAWIDAEIRACEDADHLIRWKSVRSGRSEDFVFGTFPEDAPVPSALALRALGGEPAALATWAQAPARIRLDPLRRILGVRSTGQALIDAGCPALREGRRLLFDPIAVYRHAQTVALTPLGPAQLMLRLAHRFDPRAAYFAMLAVRDQALAWGSAEIDALGSDALSVLCDSLSECTIALLHSPLAFTHLEDNEAELAHVLAAALVTGAGGQPPQRTLHGAARWRVRHSTGSAHGGLYELEQTHYWRVIDWASKEVVLEFEGESDQSYTGGPGGWSEATWVGTSDVSISDDGRAVIVETGGRDRRTVPLPGAAAVG
jgi:hypothetical protein